MNHRGFLVWAGGTFLVLGAFLIFVLAGWPGAPDSCVGNSPPTCFCEDFSSAAVIAGDPGVRQDVNTWSNLYALFTSLFVAGFVFRDRRRSTSPPNLMRSHTWIPDVYIFAVLFLGLGSMWFHASLKSWGSVFDGMSMYVYAAFLIFYTILRIWNIPLIFWIGYPATIILFTSLHKTTGSLVNIAILVTAYLFFEVWIWISTGKVMQGTRLTKGLWMTAVLAIGLAILFWALSQKPGDPLCNPTSSFQPHGLLWHPLAGVMAVLLYFYWREANDPM